MGAEVNGKMYDWGDLEISGMPGVNVGFTTLTYEDEMPVELQHGKGRLPRGYTQGGFSGSGSLEMHEDSYLRLNLAATALAGSVYGLEPFPLIATLYDAGAVAATLTLPRVKFERRSRSLGSAGSADAAKVTLAFKYMGEPIEVGL